MVGADNAPLSRVRGDAALDNALSWLRNNLNVFLSGQHRSDPEMQARAETVVTFLLRNCWIFYEPEGGECGHCFNAFGGFNRPDKWIIPFCRVYRNGKAVGHFHHLFCMMQILITNRNLLECPSCRRRTPWWAQLHTDLNRTCFMLPFF